MAPKAKMSGQIPVPTSLSSLSPGNINFTKNLYSVLCKKEEGNVLFSSLGIEFALILIYYGAYENTGKEIKEALQLPASKYEAPDTAKNILSAFDEAKVTILMANGLFLDKHVTIKQSFALIVKRYFSALVKNLDFEERDECIEEINKFVEKETDKKMGNALSQDAMETVTQAFLISSVYFKGLWKYQFDPSYTEEGDFYINVRETVKVDFMFTKGYFKYSNNFEYHVVKLPYDGSNCCMILIVPIKINGLKTIEDQIKELDLIDLIEKCSDKKLVSLQLPKFEFNQAMPNAEEVLKELKINDFFVPDKANLKGISIQSGLYVDSFVHKCYLKVCEEGIKTARVSEEDAPQDIPIQVKADHPFLFFIYDSRTKMILFFGRINKF